MTLPTTLQELVTAAGRRALSADERAQLRALLKASGGDEPAAELSALDVLAATARGQAHLTDEERTRVLEGALRRHRERAPKRAPPRWGLAAAVAVAAAVALVAGATWLRSETTQDGDREKAGGSALGVSLVRQEPGQPLGEAVTSPVTLAGKQTVRVVAELSEGGYVGVYEATPAGLQVVWRSAGTVPAGQVALGPDDGRSGLVPERLGLTRYWVVVSTEGLPPATTEAALCPGCARASFDVRRE